MTTIIRGEHFIDKVLRDGNKIYIPSLTSHIIRTEGRIRLNEFLYSKSIIDRFSFIFPNEEEIKKIYDFCKEFNIYDFLDKAYWVNMKKRDIFVTTYKVISFIDYAVTYSKSGGYYGLFIQH